MELPKLKGERRIVKSHEIKREVKDNNNLASLGSFIRSNNEEELFDFGAGPSLDKLNLEQEHYGQEEVEYTEISFETEEEEDDTYVELDIAEKLKPKILPLDYTTLSEKERSLLIDTDESLRVSDVILSNINKRRINEFLRERDFVDKFIEVGLEPMNRILMYGASGTGKTMLTRALANELGYNMLAVNIAEALSKGNAADNIHTIFNIAKRHPYCMIYLDECDSVAWNRSDEGRGEDPAMRRALTSIFQCMDRMDDTNTVICASTNLLTNCDPAFERRWNLKMEFRRPKLNLKEDIRTFVRKFGNLEVVDDVNKNFAEVVEKRTSMSYFELEMLTKNGIKRAIMDGSMKVHLKGVFEEIAMHMRVKYEFGTDKEDERVYTSSLQGNNR